MSWSLRADRAGQALDPDPKPVAAFVLDKSGAST